jgi:CTP:molybdopterin cytidylyltransferase MocA
LDLGKIRPVPYASGILLAGGASRRFGAVKLLHPFRGEPMVMSAVRAFLAAGLDEVLLVVGAHSAVGEAAASSGVRTIVNLEWASGMFSSVRAGLAAVDPRSRLVLLSPADLPLLTGEAVGKVLAGARQAGEHSVAVPVSGGRRGHPIGVPAGIVKEILRWPATARLDQALDGRFPILALPGFGPEVLRDVDTPEDVPTLAEAAR